MYGFDLIFLTLNKEWLFRTFFNSGITDSRSKFLDTQDVRKCVISLTQLSEAEEFEDFEDFEDFDVVVSLGVFHAACSH